MLCRDGERGLEEGEKVGEKIGYFQMYSAITLILQIVEYCPILPI